MTDNIQMKGTMTIRIFQHYPAASGGGQVESIAYKEPKKIHLEAEMCPHHDNGVRDVVSGTHGHGASFHTCMALMLCYDGYCLVIHHERLSSH